MHAKNSKTEIFEAHSKGKVDPRKVKAITPFRAFKNKEEVCNFVGLATYLTVDYIGPLRRRTTEEP